jgi:hypothetical protein
MNTTTMTWPGSTVVQPAIERPTAMRLAQTEYQRVADAVDALKLEDWTRPTDCTEWDVRQLVSHIAGQANLFSSPFELASQTRGQGPATARPAGRRRADLAPGRGAAAPRTGGAAGRVASRGPSRGQGPRPDSRLRTPQTHFRDGGRQRCTGDMVHRLCHRCDLHSRLVDAPPGPGTVNGSRPGAHRRPRRRHRRRHCGRVGPPPRPALLSGTHRPCRRELELRHGR